VRTAGGKLLYKAHNPGLGRVIDERHAAMMNQMMQETLATGTARKAALPGFPAAGKTGTSQDYRDAWFIGYTGHLVAGVWLGNDDNSPTKKLTGGALPADIWNRFMTAAHQGLPNADLPGMAGRTIDVAPASAAPVPARTAPLTSMLSPTPAAPMMREDAMRPVAPVPLAPAKPPAVAVAPIPHAQPTARPATPSPRPPAAAPQSRPPATTAPQPRPQIAQAMPPSSAPRPPGAIGAQPVRPQPPPRANLFSVDGFILDNLNRR
jgi:penicillin-binding protein 1A